MALALAPLTALSPRLPFGIPFRHPYDTPQYFAALHPPSNKPIFPRMPLWAAQRRLLLPSICVWLCSASARAQLSPNPGRGCPSGVTCEDFKEMIGKRIFPKIVIDHVTFDGPIHLPGAALEELLTSLKQREFDAGTKWLEEIEEVPIRSTWQDQGYFKVEVSGRAIPLGGDTKSQHFSVICHLDEGNQYLLEAISFRTSDPSVALIFSPEELRKLIPLQAGDTLNVRKI